MRVPRGKTTPRHRPANPAVGRPVEQNRSADEGRVRAVLLQPQPLIVSRRVAPPAHHIARHRHGLLGRAGGPAREERDLVNIHETVASTGLDNSHDVSEESVTRNLDNAPNATQVPDELTFATILKLSSPV